MKGYVAFLRGINISGKNKISMSELKTELEGMGYRNISTYLNSGNVRFDAEETSDIRSSIEAMIDRRFGLQIPTVVMEADHLKEILEQTPEWWDSGDKTWYDNLIFILSGETPEAIAEEIGPISEGLERYEICQDVIFWTFDRKAYQKCKWWSRTAGRGIADKLTIRTAGTVRKIAE